MELFKNLIDDMNNELDYIENKKQDFNYVLDEIDNINKELDNIKNDLGYMDSYIMSLDSCIKELIQLLNVINYEDKKLVKEILQDEITKLKNEFEDKINILSLTLYNL